MEKDSLYKGARFVLWAFVSFTIVSYIYVLVTGTYNGDYIRQKIHLSQMDLFIGFIYTILPFFVLFGIYRFFRSSRNRYKITIPTKAFGQFLLFNLVFQITVTIVFGVGAMGKEVYDAPIWIKIFIQILYRFNCFFGVLLYMSIVKKENKFQYLLLFLACILSLSKASIGFFMFVLLFLLIRHYSTIIRFVKKRFIWVILGVVVLPVSVGILYDYRDSIRSEKTITSAQSMTTTDLAFGKLAGRLSSYSNTGILMERKDIVTKLIDDYTPFQYLKEALSVYYGNIVSEKDILYTNIMHESAGNHTRNWSMMTGTAGTMMISSYSSPFAFFVTLFTILSIIFLTFFIASMFPYNNILAFIFMFFCFAVMSGTALEYMAQLMSILLFTTFFLVMNCLSSIANKTRKNTDENIL